MDTSLYKDVKVSRGFNYHYYFSPPVSGKPTLLFLHGFPSTLQDWARQIRYFQPKGYGILAPDMLGAGGTSKPLHGFQNVSYEIIGGGRDRALGR